MEHPSVQAPDTFYPEAGSHMPLPWKNQRGQSFPCSALFLRWKAFIRPGYSASPCSHSGSPEK